ncbi:MAG: lipopolysaccharide biosynthesis protein, partial [Pseudomonadota bacterium]
AGAGAGFFSQLLLARLLGADQLGLFYAVTSLVAVAGLLAVQGYPVITIRFAARYQSAVPLFKAFIRGAARQTSLAVALGSSVIILAAIAYPFEQTGTRLALIIAAAMLPFVALVNITSAIAAAARRFDICYIPEVFVRPLVFLGAIVLLASAGLAGSAVVFLLAFAAITAAVALVQAKLALPLVPKGPTAAIPRRLSRCWRGEAHMAIVVALFMTAFADVAIVMSSPLMSASDIAVFGLSLKLSFLVGFIVQIAHHVASPDLAEARNARDQAALRRTLRKAVFWPVLATLAITIAAAVFGDELLSLFGPDFAGGGPVLAVLIGAQVVIALAGPSVTMLTLSGAQRENAILCALALGTLGLADLVLIPAFGALGAAIAVLVATVIWQVAVLATLRRRGEARTDCLALLRS